jgi:mRNA-degrading endonuclease RelE of RelBE toxin-antitoxin system
MYFFVFHAAIQTDYNEAYAWYEDKSKGLGERFFSAVSNKLDEIAKQPAAFGERSKKGYREAQVDIFPFSIVYKIYKQEGVIFICSIHHHKKHPGKKYRQR